MNTVCKNGHQVPAESKFCHLCGERLSTANSEPVKAVSPIENEIEPLQVGTCLRERYIIQRQLGQGGFGRTYVAEDTGRFREKIVIKEFLPLMKNTAGLKKAEELFQREAAILYQIEHPQIPRFWEIFRQESRVFLVVDYIEGPTYKELLAQRMQQGNCFSETEILELFQSLLPVLSYLHRRGVIHRDISPDNIIFRTQDRLPVLIDMGGVKQVAMEVGAQLEAEQQPKTISFTCLGKVGYSPEEQLYLGLVAPHSDLYALAVTALVLMTGKKPQQLLNRDTLQWMWEQELKLDPVLAKTLNQMLAQKPAHRFQSAEEVLQALSPLFSTTISKKSPGQSGFIPASVSQASEQPVQLGVSRIPSQPSNQTQHPLTHLKPNWRTITNSGKSLVVALLIIAGGLTYFVGKNILIGEKTPEVLNNIADLQLRKSMREIENVPSGLFNYSGAPAFAALNSDLMKDAMIQAHPEFRLRYTEPVNGNPGSGTGITMLINGELTFAQSARPLEDEDINKAQVRGFTLQQVPIVIDGVVYYTHPDLKLPGLSVDQLQDIFRGKITNWQQVGGPNLPIVAIALDPKITSALKLLLGTDGEDLGSKVEIVRDFTSAIRKVAATPGGISYASAPIVINQKSIRPLAMAKANSKEYVPPFAENKLVNVKAYQEGTYPMTRRFFIVFRRDRSIDEKAAIAYINMILSSEGQAIAEQVGYVPIR
jgi:serine/threonine protein kinase